MNMYMHMYMYMYMYRYAKEVVHPDPVRPQTPLPESEFPAVAVGVVPAESEGLAEARFQVQGFIHSYKRPRVIAWLWLGFSDHVKGFCVGLWGFADATCNFWEPIYSQFLVSTGTLHMVVRRSGTLSHTKMKETRFKN